MKIAELHSIRAEHLSIVVRLIGIILAGILLYTATKKLMDLQAFAAHIEVLPFVQIWMTYVLTAVVVLAEYTLALMLLYHPIKRWVYLAVLLMMLIYTAYIYAILHYALILPCSCQGAFKSLSWEQHYLVNGSVAVVALTNFILVYCIQKYMSKQI